MFGAQRDNVVCCKPAPFAIEASTGCTSGSLLAARHSGRFRRAVRSIARIHHEFIYFSSIYLFFVYFIYFSSNAAQSSGERIGG